MLAHCSVVPLSGPVTVTRFCPGVGPVAAAECCGGRAWKPSPGLKPGDAGEEQTPPTVWEEQSRVWKGDYE